MTGRKYADGPAVQNAYKNLWERLDALPGVTASGGVTSLPLSGYFAWGPITVEGRTPPPGENFINADIRVASGRYFEAMDIPLRAGRLLHRRRHAGQAARRPRRRIHGRPSSGPARTRSANAIRFGDLQIHQPLADGRRRRRASEAIQPRRRRPDRAVPAAHPIRRPRHVHRRQRPARRRRRSRHRVRAQIRELDADLPIYRLKTMDERVSASLARRRFSMTLLALFATIALVLATVGIYSVISYLVTPGRARDRHPHRARRDAGVDPETRAVQQGWRWRSPASASASSPRSHSRASCDHCSTACRAPMPRRSLPSQRSSPRSRSSRVTCRQGGRRGSIRSCR